MSTSIPYHPSLALGNIVPEKNLETLKKISNLQTPIEIAQDEMNSQIELKHTIESTIQEMINLGIDTSDLQKQLLDVKQSIIKATQQYTTKRISQQSLISAEKAKLSGMVSSSIESPVDYTKTFIKDDMPLSSDSLKLDVKYFSFDKNNQSSASFLSSIKTFVGLSTEFLGSKRSAEVSESAQRQASSQIERHEIQGTLIITATCTHKNALLLNPLILNVDKAIRSWNTLYTDKIKTNSLSDMMQIAHEEGAKNERKMQIISGATCGSSLVGMVHIVKSNSTKSHQVMMSTATKLQGQADLGSWFSNASGCGGMDASFAADIKNLLSSQEINSHISLITMGVIPEITSNKVELGVKQISSFDPKAMMDKLAIMNNITTGASNSESVSSGADKARQIGQMINMESRKIEAVLGSLEKIDGGSNQILDTDSLMSAFDNYIKQVHAGKAGLPINYYLKPITRAQLAQMWVSKYYPEKYLAISGDDSADGKADKSKE